MLQKEFYFRSLCFIEKEKFLISSQNCRQFVSNKSSCNLLTVIDINKRLCFVRRKFVKRKPRERERRKEAYEIIHELEE